MLSTYFHSAHTNVHKQISSQAILPFFFVVSVHTEGYEDMTDMLSYL